MTANTARTVEDVQPITFASDAREVGVVYTRDIWLHIVDIARATGRPLTLSGRFRGEGLLATRVLF